MKFDLKVHEAYQQAYAHAMRSRDNAKKHGEPMSPIALNTLMDHCLVSYRQKLGIMDIPTNLIVGVEESSEQSESYTQDFYPVAVPNSLFADQWRNICGTYLSCRTSLSDIQCVEYLGRFYVSDGLKRVSIAKCMCAPTIRSQITRILPIYTNTKAVQLYYDFLNQFRQTQMYQIQFTQANFFEKFQTALGFRVDHIWTDLDRSYFLPNWNRIESAFYKSNNKSLRITAADAMVVLLEKYSYDQIVHMDTWVLARVFQIFWKEFYALSFPDVVAENGQMIVGVLHPTETLQTA